MFVKITDFFSDFIQVPAYHLVLEAILLVWVVWLLIRRYRRPRREVKLTKEEEEELLAEWKPEPLVPEVDPDHPMLHLPTVESKPGKELIIDGKTCLNLGSHNYLGLAGRKELEEAAVNCMRRFGVGSCGPRAFYGTAGIIK